MIKVMHVITGLNTGGAEMMLYKMLSRTDRNKFQPVVISLSGPGSVGDRIKGLNIPVIDIGMKRGRPTLTGMRRLVVIARKTKPDIIQGWMYHGNLAAQLAAFFIPGETSVVWNIRQSLYSLTYENKLTALVIKVGSYLSRFPAYIIYNSKTSAGQHEAIGYRASARVFIPNGFDTDRFVPSEEARASVRSELGLDKDAVLIGLICRYHPMKDHMNFLKAASIVSAEHSSVHFVLAGDGVNEGNSHLRNEMDNLKISNHTHLLGERKDTPRLSAALDIAVSSSSHGEGFSNVIGEAMSCAVPCVVTDVGDSAWIVGDFGLVVPPRNPEALASACSNVIEWGKKKRQVTGQRARQRVLDKFSIDSIVRQYEALYVKALNRRIWGKYMCTTELDHFIENNVLGKLSSLAKKSFLLTCGYYVFNNIKTAIRFKMGKIASESGMAHADKDESASLKYINEVFNDYKYYSGKKLFYGRVAEVGPGDNCGVGLLFLRDGCSSVDLVDRFFTKRNVRQHADIYRALIMSDPLLKNKFENADRFEEKSFFGITRYYGDDASAEKFFLAHSNYDFIVSRAVLEHVYDPEAALMGMASALAPGGMMLHKVDLRDHGMFSTHFHELKFYEIPSWLYPHLTKASGNPNRVLINHYSFFLQKTRLNYEFLITRLAGVGEITPHVPYSDIPKALRSESVRYIKSVKNKFSSALSAVSDKDLSITGFFLVAKKGK